MKLRSPNRLITGLSLATIATLSMAGCAAEINGSVEEPSATAIAVDQVGYSQQDLMFAQMTISHHEQALETSIIAHHEEDLEMVSLIEDSRYAEARTLAKEIATTQKQKISKIKKMLKELAVA